MKQYFADINQDVMSLSDDKMIIKCKKYGWNNSSFGNIIIPSSDCMNNIYKWKIKLIDTNTASQSQNCLVGITSGKHVKLPFVLDDTATFYGYNAYNGEKLVNAESNKFDSENYGDKAGTDDIVGIVLSENKLSLSVNGKDQGIAFQEIKTDKDLDYRFVVSFCGTKLSVKLVSFEVE